MKNYTLAIISASLFTAGCDASSIKKDHNSSLVNYSEEVNWTDPNPNLSLEINNIIKNKLQNIKNGCTNSNEGINSDCKFITINAGKEYENSNSLGYRVLIIDDSSMSLASYTRYKKRVLENIIETEDGNFILDNRSLEIPKIAKEILSDTFELPKYEKIPSELLIPSQDLFYEKLGQILSNVNFKYGGQGHSTNIFNYIANNSPESQFLLAHISDNKLKNTLCSSNKESNKKKIIDNLFNSQSYDLNRYIKLFNISFISLSSGISNEFFQRLSIECNNVYLSQDLKNHVNKSYFDNFLNKLLAGTEAILIQANASSKYEINRFDKGYYSDCQEMTNRIRVGYVNDLSNSIPSLGTRDFNENLVIDENRNSKNCTDLYVNLSVERKRPYPYTKGVAYFSTFNIGAEPPVGAQIASSYTTPIGVSYLLYLKTKNPHLTNKNLLEQIQVLKGENYIVLDPSRHKQLPIYELGYLK